MKFCGGGGLSQPPSEESAISSISVTFDGNNGSPSTTTRTYTNGSQVSNLPSATRTGYSFDGWYKKKNYITESVMDDFMSWIETQDRSHGEAGGSMKKDGNVYSWAGESAGYWASNEFTYYEYHTGIYLTGTYRLSYYAYCPDFSHPSTRLNIEGNIVMDFVDSSSWKYYSGQGTFSNQEVILSLGYNYSSWTYFRDIRFERIDIDDFDNKNNLSENVMDNFMSWIETQDRSHGEAGGSMKKDGNVYSWAGESAGYWASNEFTYYEYHTGIYLTGTYRLSYYAYCPDFSHPSTRLNIEGNIVMDFVDSSSWKYYSGQGTFSNQEVILSLGYNYNSWTYFRDIRFERIDTTVYEQLQNGDTIKEHYFDKLTYYAKWTERTYTLNVSLDRSSAWSEEPTISISACGTSGTLTRGSTWTVTVPYSKFTYDEFVQLAIASENYEKYVVLFQSKPTVESPYATAFSWRQRTNLTLTAYVFQKYKIDFDKGYAEDGTVPNPVYKLHGDSVTLPINELTHLGFGPNGWNTSPEGTGASYADGELYTENKDLTLYPNWRAYHANVDIWLVTLDKSGNVSSEIGGTVKVDYKTASNNQAVDISETSTGGHLSFATLVGYTSWAYATANAGYVFLGFSETRSAPPHTVDEVANTGYPFPPDYSVYNLYVYFQQVSDNQLKYDSKEKYWYFEDGMYPQSEVDSELSATLENQSFSAASYTLQYNNGKEQTVNVYKYNGQEYALVEVNEVRKWFVVEPIRWRVSEYGVSEDAKPELWQNYGDTKSLVAASDKILFASIMTAEKIDDSKETDSNDFWLNNYVSTLDFTYSSEFSHSQDSFAGAGGQDVSQSGTVSTNVAVYSTKDTTLSSSAKLTAFASFLLYGTTAYADTYDAYWTRDLETDGHSEYGCGVVVTSYGGETLRWLNQMCGVRLSYYCTEVSRY